MKPRKPKPWWMSYPRKYWTAEERELAYREGWRPKEFTWPERVETNLPGHYEPPVESREQAQRRRVAAIVKANRASRRKRRPSPPSTRRTGMSAAEPPQTITRNLGSVFRVR